MTHASVGPAILISRTLPEGALRLARSRAQVDVHDEDAPLQKTQLIDRLKARHGLICLITDQIDDEVLATCPDLRVVANVAVGFNNVDVAAATRRGVVVTNTPDVLTDTTADFAWALLMATARRVVEGDRYVREGRFKQWEYMVLLGGDVHGKTLGIVGFGRIGRAMARRALGFGMRVLYQDAVPADAATERGLNATRVDLATLLKESDFVSVHTPLLPETRHLIGIEALKAMKKTAYLINASRGPWWTRRRSSRGFGRVGSPAPAWTCSRRSPRCIPVCSDSPTWCWLRISPAHPTTRGSRWPPWPSRIVWLCSRAGRRRHPSIRKCLPCEGSDWRVAELLALHQISKRYDPDAPLAVDGLSLTVAEGEILALLGPSGCGKTTTLRIIAGFEAPDSGTVAIRGTVMAGPNRMVPPEGRGVGIVFQDYALFPHLTVADNVAFGLQQFPRVARRERIAAILELVDLPDLSRRYPHELSGGQQQRVAVARALAPAPGPAAARRALLEPRRRLESPDAR